LKSRTEAIFGIITILGITVSISLIFSASLSVGEAANYQNSEACASCHYEIPYYEGWKNSPHGIENVSCQDCHSKTIIDDDICLSCHEDYDISNKTKFLWDWQGAITRVDSHDKSPHVGAQRCVSCHFYHEFERGTPKEETIDVCKLCHSIYTGPRTPEPT
jgi:hypothetical protein